MVVDLELSPPHSDEEEDNDEGEEDKDEGEEDKDEGEEADDEGGNEETDGDEEQEDEGDYEESSDYNDTGTEGDPSVKGSDAAAKELNREASEPASKRPREGLNGDEPGNSGEGKRQPGWIDLEADGGGAEQPGKQLPGENENGGGLVGEAPATVQLVADHYSKRDNQSRLQRDRSPIIHLKKLNNWVKSMLIHNYTKPGARVLDLACGKGGDFAKWSHAHIGYYVGIDVAMGSIEDARLRYNGEAQGWEEGTREGGGRGRRGLMPFAATLACGDCWGVPLDAELGRFGPFDVVSCQFALHYSFETRARARMAMHNITSMLKPGGKFIGTIPDANVLVHKLRAAPGLNFGNEVYSVSFDQAHASKNFPDDQPFGLMYNFSLEDAVHCPEWLVPFHCLKQMAAEVGLKLELYLNLHEFVQKFSQDRHGEFLMRRTVGDTWWQNITEDEWDAVYIYCAFVFVKDGKDEDEVKLTGKRDREEVPKKIESDDIIVV